MNKKIYHPIQESRFDNVNMKLEEDELIGTRDKKWFIKGIYGEAEVQDGNNNQRYYRYAPFYNETERYIKEEINFIHGNKAVGAAEHPHIESEDYYKVLFEETAHKTIELKWKDKVLYGKSQILASLPKGALVIGMLKEGIPLGISLRALANLTYDSILKLKVVNDLRIVCWE